MHRSRLTDVRSLHAIMTSFCQGEGRGTLEPLYPNTPRQRARLVGGQGASFREDD